MPIRVVKGAKPQTSAPVPQPVKGMSVTSALLKNYLTTAFGILAGMPAIVIGAGVVLNPKWNHYLLITAGIGAVGLGVVSKAFNNHSTADQVQQATDAAKK